MSKKTDLELLEEANARIEALQADLNAATALVDRAALDVELANKRATDAEAKAIAEKARAEEAGELLEASMKTNEKLMSEQKTAEQRATEIAARHGIKPTKQAAAETDEDGILTAFAAITDATERANFYRKHKAEIRKHFKRAS
jgi:hypothetical protein